MRGIVLLQTLQDNLNEQLSLYRRLQEKIAAQEDAISREDYDCLNEILGQKDEIIREIDVLGQKAAAARQALVQEHSLSEFSFAELSRHYPPAVLQPLQEAAEQIKKMLGKMLEAEQGNEHLLRGKMETIGAALGKVRVGKQAGKAYKTGFGDEGLSAFFDRRQ